MDPRDSGLPLQVYLPPPHLPFEDPDTETMASILCIISIITDNNSRISWQVKWETDLDGILDSITGTSGTPLTSHPKTLFIS